MYLVLYRKYRPKTLNEIVGQQVVVNILKNSLQTNKISHAYLFTGPRGIGKTSIAKIFSKAINCLNKEKQDACLECDICKLIDKNQTTDIIEIDAASNNGVDEIRVLKEKVRYAPTVCKNKVYIIDEVHMLTNSAFNALLKTLEEPPKNVIFIFCTTEANKIPETILSRVQRFDFNTISINDIEKQLSYISSKENINIEKDAIFKIASLSNGGLRDALSLLDKVWAYSENITLNDVIKVTGIVEEDIIIDLLYNINIKDIIKVNDILDNLYKNGKDINLIINCLIETLKNVLYNKKVNFINKNLKKLQIMYEKEIYQYFDILKELNSNIRFTSDKKTYLDLAIFKMLDISVLKNNIDLDIKNNINFDINEDSFLKKEYNLFNYKENKILEEQIIKNNKENPKNDLDNLKNEQNLEISNTNDIKKDDFLYENEKIVYTTFLEVEDLFNNYIIQKQRIIYEKQIKELIDSFSLVLQSVLKNYKIEIISSNLTKLLITLDEKQNCINIYQDIYYNEIFEEFKNEIFPNLDKIIFIDKPTFLKIREEYVSIYKQLNDKSDYIKLTHFDLEIEKSLKIEKDKTKNFEKNFKNLLKNLNLKEKKNEPTND